MKSVEKVFAALDHEEPEIIPVVEGFSTQSALQKFLGNRLERIHDSFEKRLFAVRWWGDDIVGIDGNLPILASETLVHDPDYNIVRFGYGAIQLYRVDPHFLKTLHSPVRYPEDLERISVPDLEDLRPKIKKLTEEVRYFKEKGYFVSAVHHDPFVTSWRFLRGLKEFLLDMVRNPSFAEKMVEFAIKPQIELSKIIIDEAGVHAIHIGGDLGTNKSLMMSPNSYRRILYPWEKNLVETYHKKGVKVFRHCHGNINLILNDIINAGYDSIDPLEPYEDMNLTEIKEKYGEKISLRGGISKYIGMWSQKQLEEHVSSVIRIAAPEGGYIIQSAGGAPKEMPRENVFHYRKLINHYRKMKNLRTESCY